MNSSSGVSMTRNPLFDRRARRFCDALFITMVPFTLTALHAKCAASSSPTSIRLDSGNTERTMFCDSAEKAAGNHITRPPSNGQKQVSRW